jgi:hypothetical protein
VQSSGTPAQPMFPGATRRESPLRLPALLDALWSGPTPPSFSAAGPAGTAWRGSWSASGATEDVVAAPTQGGLLGRGCSSAA